MTHWRKLGKIFDPTQYRLPAGCSEFAQSPQALVFDDFVRIYFSTRSRDAHGGEYLSHIAFVDMRKDFREVIAVSRHTVIELGKTGCFDEHGIFPMNVLRHGDLIYGYTSGVNRRISVPVDSSIGLAISRDDGFTFQRVGDGPVLSASLREPCLIADPFVQVHHDMFHMWYIFGAGWKRLAAGTPLERIYRIGHAVSSDGIHWLKEEGKKVIPARLGADECQALPTTTSIAGRQHMFFCYRQAHDFRDNRDRGYRIGHAHSDDLVVWTRDDEQIRFDRSENDWDSEMQCYPHVFELDGRIYMLYNGNEFGRHGFGLAILDGMEDTIQDQHH